MPDYSKGKIYKIVSDSTNDIYIGSTSKRYLSERFSKHKYDFKTGKMPCSSREILKHGDARIVLIENFPCTTRNELEARELFQIRKLRDEGTVVVNLQENGKTEEQKKAHKAEVGKAYREKLGEELLGKKRDYHHAHKEEISAKSKEYREANNDLIKAQKKADYEKHKDTILAQHAEYREAHRDKFIDYGRKHYEENKERYQAYSKTPWKCELCDKAMTLGAKSNHLKSLSHINKISTNSKQI